MPKNIVIFSDGTGQRGGILVDERRSNIYKLYRASRCGPDSCANPDHQVAFYDPGIGTLPSGSGFIENLTRRIYNLVSQALGVANVFSVSLKPTTKLMAQHLFGSRRRVMLSFERQPLPGACHVDQDVPHSQGRRALGHLTTFDRVLSALHR